MKLIKISVLLSVVSFSVLASDNCTKQVNGYVAGLEAGTTLNTVSKEKVDAVLKELAHIKELRARLKDCDVVQHIPTLKQSSDALKYASEQARKG